MEGGICWHEQDPRRRQRGRLQDDGARRPRQETRREHEEMGGEYLSADYGHE